MVKCNKCKRNIKELPYKCHRCGRLYCGNHRLPEEHNCSGLKNENMFNRLKSHKHHVSKDYREPKLTSFGKFKRSLRKGYYKILHWLKKREHYRYNYKKRTNYIITTILLFLVSLVGFSIFYSNVQRLNEINLWMIKLGGVLLLTSSFFIIKYGWRIIKELINLLKRQRNWLKYLIIILIIFLLWQAYDNKDTILNPVFEIYDETNFSIFSPLNFDDLSVSNIEKFYYGLEEGETRVKDMGFLHFDKIPVYYKLNNCIGERRDRVVQAFDIIERGTNGILPFEERSSGDIIVNCNFQLETEHASGYGGPEYYVGSNEITSSSVDLYAHDPQFSRCESYPVTEIHEILHALGFDHISNKNSIMYVGDTSPIILEWDESDQPYVCINMEIEIIDCLKYIYSSGVEGTSCPGIPFL